jgi:hypothetical protein
VSLYSPIVSDVETVRRLEILPTLDEGDHERFTHIVLEGFEPKDGEFVSLDNSVVDAMVNASPVRALCGKVWVPGRDPSKYPVCATCLEVAQRLGFSLPGS